ncbi:zinc ABC transporter substrate-binding protein [Candidatus Bathyarchaeota archaeon]|nr:zinc ABC transporter substrate-binding protein [Candidatus Bathyarchaeota archaeon]
MKNKKRLTLSVALLLLPLMLLSVTVTEAQAADKPIIVCTTSAVGSVVEEFVGDTADVLVLVRPGLCPADFDMKPGYIDAVSKAQILFKQNITGEFWLAGLLEASGNSDLTVVAIPGVYNTPAGAKSYIRGVGGNLSEILGLDLDAKTAEMLSDVDEVSSLMTNQAATVDASNVKVICMGWLKTFIESAGFTVVATFNPPETLSAGDITSLLETAQSEGVALVVDNLQIDTEFGAGIASQVGAEHVVLTNFPGAVPNTETLPEMLQYNAEQLFNGTVTWKATSTLKAEKVDLQNQVAIFQIAAALAAIAAVAEAVLLYAKRKK